MPLVAQLADEVQHLGDLAHRDRRGRLVHQHDLGFRQHGAGDGHRLALAARHLLDQVARPRLRLQLREDLAGAPVHGGVVENPERADALAQFAAQKHVGGGGEIVAQRQVLIDDLDAVLARFDRACAGQVLARPCASRRGSAGKLPAIILTSVDLPAPLSPISPTTCPGSSDSDTSLTAWMAPKCFEILASSRTAIPLMTSRPPTASAVAPARRYCRRYGARLTLSETGRCC